MCFSSVEAADYRKLFVVGEKLDPFERDRLMLSLYKSLGHRPTALSDAGGLCATIITKLVPSAHKGVLQRQLIIQTALVALTRFDKLAAQHYQAFHKL